MFLARTRNLVKTLYRFASNSLSPDLVQALKDMLPDFPAQDLTRKRRPFVDKSGQFLDLLASESEMYSLHRPPRMGKTLTVSMLAHHYLDPMLFENLKLGALLKTQEEKWNQLRKKETASLTSAEQDFLTVYTPLQFRKQYPVLYFNFGQLSDEQASSDFLEAGFHARCRMYAEKIFGIEYNDAQLSSGFRKLIGDIKVKTGLLPVIIIDEYDSPLRNKEDPVRGKHYQGNLTVVRNIFRGLKDAKITFGFVTGITLDNQLLLTTAANFISDLSFDPEFAEVCGFTLNEVETLFDAKIKEFAARLKISPADLVKKVTKHYNGYCFSEEIKPVFNPFAVQECLSTFSFIFPGIVTVQADYVKRVLHLHPLLFLNPTQPLLPWNNDSTYEERDDLVALRTLWRLGYFSPKLVDNTKVLAFTNVETRIQMMRWFNTKALSRQLRLELMNALYVRNISELVQILNKILQKLNLFEMAESNFKTCIHTLLFSDDGSTQQEDHADLARADIVVETCAYVLIVEVKLWQENEKVGEAAQRGLAQIADKHYHSRYLGQDPQKTIYALALSIDAAQRQINEFKCAEAKEDGKLIVQLDVDLRAFIIERKRITEVSNEDAEKNPSR